MKKSDIIVGVEYAYGDEEDGRWATEYYHRYGRCKVLRHGAEKINRVYSASKTPGVWIQRLDKETGEPAVYGVGDRTGEVMDEIFVPNRHIREAWDTYVAGGTEYDAQEARWAEERERQTEVRARNGRAIIAALRDRGFDVDKHVNWKLRYVENGETDSIELSFDAIADLLGITLEEVK